MRCHQYLLKIPARAKGLHQITEQVEQAAVDLARIRVGLLHLFIQHTSASLTLNENADPDVPRDLDWAVSKLAPEDAPYRHTCEGPDDMPAHIKASLTDAGLTIPVRDGRLCLGTWQGIFLWEHRRHAGSRKIVLTLTGSDQDPIVR